jgi:DNA-binding Xre family transcriptional regulator
MPIAVDIDVILARRKMSVGELADRVGITPANLAVLKNGRAKAVRFSSDRLCGRGGRGSSRKTSPCSGARRMSHAPTRSCIGRCSPSSHSRVSGMSTSTTPRR